MKQILIISALCFILSCTRFHPIHNQYNKIEGQWKITSMEFHKNGEVESKNDFTSILTFDRCIEKDYSDCRGIQTINDKEYDFGYNFGANTLSVSPEKDIFQTVPPIVFIALTSVFEIVEFSDDLLILESEYHYDIENDDHFDRLVIILVKS